MSALTLFLVLVVIGICANCDEVIAAISSVGAALFIIFMWLLYSTSGNEQVQDSCSEYQYVPVTTFVYSGSTLIPVVNTIPVCVKSEK